jgi:hypothetical protein
MGITICPKHGRSGFREVCEHVDADFKMGRRGDYRLLSFVNMLVCDACWDGYDLARLESHPGIASKPFYELDDESPIVKKYDRVYERLRYSLWCSKCIAEIRENAARVSSAAPPDNGLHPNAK